jgi:hypothetical protein
MLGVISAISPEKATVKAFRQKFREEKEVKGNETVSITKENPFEIRIRDLGAGSDSNFKLWIETSENKEVQEANEKDREKDGINEINGIDGIDGKFQKDLKNKKTVSKKLIIRKVK